MRRSTGESLPDNTTQREIGALHVVNAECNPLVVGEIELAQIPLQVLLADVMTDAADAAL